MEENKHYVHPAGFASAITAGIVYTLCAVFVALWPQTTLQLFNNWFHGIDLTILAKGAIKLTFWSFFAGLIKVLIFFYVVGVLYAWAYNTCVANCQRRRWIR